MKTPNYAKVDRSRCAACGACIKVCPKSAMTIYKGCYAEPDMALCVGCGICARECPANCITTGIRGDSDADK